MALPALFVSHGSPTFALEPGHIGRRLGRVAAELPRPRAILAISPHWLTPWLEATTGERLATIHDFGGFPSELYEIEYPSPGAPAIAERVLACLAAAGFPARGNPGRGLDHGAWVPLLHLYPDAEVPVIQLSLPMTRSLDVLIGLGAALAPLRQEGVLIVASGGITHNLYDLRLDGREAGYVREFADWVGDAVASGDLEALKDYRRQAPHAQRAHPTDEHFLPLFVAIGAAGSSWSRARRLEGGVDCGAISMDSYAFAVAPEHETAFTQP